MSGIVISNQSLIQSLNPLRYISLCFCVIHVGNEEGFLSFHQNGKLKMKYIILSVINCNNLLQIEG